MTINIIWSYVILIGAILLPLLVLPDILRTRRSPGATVAWSLGVVLIPFIAVPLYFLIAGRTLPQRKRNKRRLDLPRDAVVPEEQANEVDRLLRHLGLPGASNGNSIVWQNDGCSAYTALLDVIDNAKRSISVCVYIFEADEIGQQVLDRLEKRAREGLEVCLLVDGVGSIDLADAKLQPLRDAGAKVATFNRLLFGAPRGLANLRNHRKSVIADSRRVWSGGRNISGDYLGADPDNNKCWTDLTFVIEGPAARIYEQVFASDWAFASGEDLKRDRTPIAAIANGDCVAQVVPSGPDAPNDPLFSVLLKASYAARKRIWIVTPYFVPEDSLQHAWVLAAKLGVDVRFVVPDKSDSRLVDVARMDYLRELQRAGAKILRYRGATLHMKAFVFDDTVAAVGSANMDIRSLFLNFEAMTFVYSEHAVGSVSSMIESLFGKSSEGVRPIGRYRGMLSGAARLLAPLL